MLCVLTTEIDTNVLIILVLLCNSLAKVVPSSYPPPTSLLLVVNSELSRLERHTSAKIVLTKTSVSPISLILLLLFFSTEHRFICVLRTLCLCTLRTCSFDRPRCSFPNFTSCTHTVILTGYFNGTPAAAAAWGLDVIAPIHFGKPGNESVDLVVSGPNEGWNLGPFLYTLSGTLGAAYFSVERGVSQMFVPLSQLIISNCISIIDRSPLLPFLLVTALTAPSPPTPAPKMTLLTLLVL